MVLSAKSAVGLRLIKRNEIVWEDGSKDSTRFDDGAHGGGSASDGKDESREMHFHICSECKVANVVPY